MKLRPLKLTFPAPAPPPEEPGYLTIDSYPWSRVTEGGKVVCPQTACVKVQFAPGAHTLTFDNAEQSLHFVMTVTVKSGETKAIKPGLK